jgi:predicted permease
MLANMFLILRDVLLPVLAIAGLGALVQYFKPLSIETLSRLTIYLFVPVFLFVHVAQSTFTYRDIGMIGLASLLPMFLVGVPLYFILRRRVPGPALAALLVGGLFFNAANFGLPVAELAFPGRGGAVEALVVMFLNTTTFFVGYVILSMGQGHGFSAAWGYFRLPMIYVILLALFMRDYHLAPPLWLDHALHTISDGMIPLALVTLGAQLVARARWPRWKLTLGVMAIKLAILPAVTAAVVVALGLWPWPGAQLVLASAGPTAVNILLLTLELDGDADLAADAVFWTTIASALSVTVVLTLVRAAM